VIDEVLAVGDAQFQKENASAKCARLPKATAERCYSSAIIWLRYEISAQHRFGSNRVAWPKRAIVDFGRISNMSQAAAAHVQHLWHDPPSAPGNDAVRLRLARAYPADGSSEITVQTPIVLEFEYWNLIAGQKLNLSLIDLE